MSNMKAIVKQSAASDQFIFMDIPVPAISEDEILVRVKAIGVGIHDGYFFPENMQFPYPIGIEGAGIVDKVGHHVTGVKLRDKIAFVSVLEPKGGTYAEYAVLGKNSLVVPIPQGMSFEQAAAVPVAGNTILKVFKALQLKPGDSVFIAGASGAIGTFAIQLAHANGCTVAASASKENHEYMMSLGAEKTVDYHDPDWTAQIRQWKPQGVDAAIAIQPNTSIPSMETVKDGGNIISVSGDLIIPERNISFVQFPYQTDAKDELIDLMNRIALNEITLHIEKTYAFEHALEALTKKGTRHARGKSVIRVD